MGRGPVARRGVRKYSDRKNDSYTHTPDTRARYARMGLGAGVLTTQKLNSTHSRGAPDARPRARRSTRNSYLPPARKPQHIDIPLTRRRAQTPEIPRRPRPGPRGSRRRTLPDSLPFDPAMSTVSESGDYITLHYITDYSVAGAHARPPDPRPRELLGSLLFRSPCPRRLPPSPPHRRAWSRGAMT